MACAKKTGRVNTVRFALNARVNSRGEHHHTNIHATHGGEIEVNVVNIEAQRVAFWHP